MASLLPYKTNAGDGKYYFTHHQPTGGEADNSETLKPVLYAKDLLALSTNNEEREFLIGKPNLLPSGVEHELREIIYNLFQDPEHSYRHIHPSTNPTLPPEPRGRRHRNFYVYQLNQFRHFWKVSRLLMRIAGGLVLALDPLVWRAMAIADLDIKGERKQAFRMYKRMGQGGPMALFLNGVQPFTRLIRIVLATARAWEAKVDNRLYEVALAEAL
jgi:hypothetical protein